MSKTAAVSSRQELYPRGMAAERALRLGIGALSGLGLGEAREGLHRRTDPGRIESRYPEAEPLPDRPELDDLLERVGLDVRWDAENNDVPPPGSVDSGHIGFVASQAAFARPRAPATQSKSRRMWPKHDSLRSG